MAKEQHFEVSQAFAAKRLGHVIMYLAPILAYVFLWLPILVLVVFSFNDSPAVSNWQGFTLRWYKNIFNTTFVANTLNSTFQTKLMLKAVSNSFLIAMVSTIVSTILGTSLALALARGGAFVGKQVIRALLYIPVVIPDITQGVSLAVFFRIVFFTIKRLSGGQVVFNSSFFTIVVGHVAFNIAFVTVVVGARLAMMDKKLEEAARDLGANHWQAFLYVTLPVAAPGIIAGALLAFTLSLNDFVITFFNSGIGTTTLPVYVYGMLKQRVSPEINAISTLIIVISSLLIGISLYLQRQFIKDDDS